MPKKSFEKTRAFIDSLRSKKSGVPAAVEPLSVEPNVLRDAVCDALSALSLDERSDFRNRLIAELRRAGLSIRSSLLMLGASASTTEELTAPEVASLIRYVRLTEPKAMMAVEPSLKALFSSSGIRAVERAA